MLRRPPGGDLTIWFDEKAIPARTGDGVAVALLAAGITTTRTTPISGAARGPFCLTGACFDCLVTIDGLASRQACLAVVRDGMTVETGRGKPLLPAGGEA